MVSQNLDLMKACLARLENWLAKHRRRFRGGLNRGATAVEIATLEKQLASSIPSELRLLLIWHNGQREDFIGKFEQDWQLMSCTDIAAAKKELDASAPTTGWQKNWLPFLDDDAGDYVFLDTGSNPAPVRAFWLGNKEPETLASSLEVWLAEFVGRVEKEEYHEDPERGTFMRGS